MWMTACRFLIHQSYTQPLAVFDVDHDAERAASLGMEVNGFSFEGMDAPGLDYALNRWGHCCYLFLPML